MNIDNTETKTAFNYHSVSKENLKEILKKEAEEYYILKKSYSSNTCVLDSGCWIINKNWLRNWKTFTGYENIKSSKESLFSFGNKSKHEINESAFPGPISNDKILLDKKYFYSDIKDNPENYILLDELSQENDFKLIDEKIWNFFHSRYGGGPMIKKPTIIFEDGNSRRKLYEVYYQNYNILLLPTREFLKSNIGNICEVLNSLQKVKSIYISRQKKLSELKTKIINVVFSDLQNQDLINNCFPTRKFSENNIRLWQYCQNETESLFTQLTDKNNIEKLKNNNFLNVSNLNYLEFYKDEKNNSFEIEKTDILIVEMNSDPNSNQDWLFQEEKIVTKKTNCDFCRKYGIFNICCDCKDVWYCSKKCLLQDRNYHVNQCLKKQVDKFTYSTRSKKGLVGLSNLGNTCFMNTSLQCIANCYELANYFLTDSYKKDLNMINPLGSKGVLADSFSSLLKNLYYGEDSVYTPRNFKRAISSFQSMFTGYQQHDTQEFLNYLLDGVHEDLNRVINKPFVVKDETPKEDSVKSREDWIGFLKRNQSVLVDLLYGQYKSTINCPCGNRSTTFDPYMSMAIPLVNKIQPFEIKCFFVFYDISITPLELKIRFSTKTTVMAFRNKLAKILNINPWSFVISTTNEKNTIEAILNSKNFLLKENRYGYSRHRDISNELVYYVYQINPRIFNSSSFNNSISYSTDLKNINKYLLNNNNNFTLLFDNDYDEDESDPTQEDTYYYYYSPASYSNNHPKFKGSIKYSNDNNYGLSNEYIPVELKHFFEGNNGNYIKSNISRLIYLNIKNNTYDIYKEVFNYYLPFIKTKLKVAFNINDFNDEELFIKLFSNKSNMPFELFINSNYHFSNKVSKSVFTNESLFSKNDGACCLSINSKETLDEFINKIPLNENNERLDNTFYFLSELKRNLSNLENRDVFIEVRWNEDFNNYSSEFDKYQSHDFILNPTKQRQSLTLDDCFKQLCKEEQLDDNNKWYCPICKDHTKAKVKLEIYKTPPVMILHLKRFKANSKIETFVDFPIEGLDMSKYLIGESKKENNIYDLFAVAHHLGGMGGGHYIASAKNYFDNKWYNFNDSSVSNENLSDIVSSSAFVLFYKKRNINEFLNLDEIYDKKFIEYN